MKQPKTIIIYIKTIFDKEEHYKPVIFGTTIIRIAILRSQIPDTPDIILAFWTKNT